MCPHCVRPWIQKDRTPQGVPSRRREIYLVSLIIGKNGDNYRCLHLCSGKSHNCSIFLIKVVISAGCKVMIKWKWILLMSRWGVGRNVLRTTLCRELQLFSNSISIISLWSRRYPHFSGEENRARLNSDLFVWLQSSHSLCYTVWLPWSPVLFFYESTVTPSVPTAPNHEQICREWVQVIWRETLFISALNFTVLSVHACVCLWWLNSTFLVNQYGPPHSMHLAGSFLPSFLPSKLKVAPTPGPLHRHLLSLHCVSFTDGISHMILHNSCQPVPLQPYNVAPKEPCTFWPGHPALQKALHFSHLNETIPDIKFIWASSGE